MARNILFFSLSVLILSIYLICGTGCLWSNGNGESKPTPKTATVQLKVKYGENLIGPGPCKQRLSWVFTPGTLTGTSGQNTPFNFDGDYTSQISGGSCYYNDTRLNLKEGTWTITVTGFGAWGSWSTSCTRNLSAGQNFVYFTINKSGCSNIGYP